MQSRLLKNPALTHPPRRTPIARHPVHGVLLLDKPAGLSSHTAVQKVRYLLRAQKAGHTGTLDPFASGILPICLGAATKFARFHLEANKGYEALVHLGVQTETGDREGAIIQTHPVNVTQTDLQAAATRFQGAIEQIPPMYSALKKDGKPLYAYARAGQTVPRDPRPIHIHALNLAFSPHFMTEDSEESSHGLTMRVTCSKGTYIRTLAEDIGQFLGCGAYVHTLRRYMTGNWLIEACTTLAALENLDETSRLGCVLPIDSLVEALPTWQLSAEEAGRFLTGQRLRLETISSPSQAQTHHHQEPSKLSKSEDAPLWRIYGPEQAFLGVAHHQGGELIAQRLLNPLEIAQVDAQEKVATVATVATRSEAT
jgi:tRNA pseudouridine55 synthase